MSAVHGTESALTNERLITSTCRKTSQKPEDEWTVADVKDLNKLVGKVKASKTILVFAGEPSKAGGGDRL